VSAADRLAEHLDAAAESTDPFTVDSLDRAEWAMRKVRQKRRAAAEVSAAASAERARIDAWERAEIERLTADESFFLSHLERFHRDRLEEDPKAKTIKLPSGELKLRAASDRVEVTDYATFILSQPLDSPLLRVKTEPDKAAIKAHIKKSGEVPEGVVFIPGKAEHPTFSVDVAP
jgi:phage host-nuclease inhibitor protein Gam